MIDRHSCKTPLGRGSELGGLHLTALVVDDHEIARRLIQAMLDCLDVESTPVASAEEALDCASRRRFDVALVDFGLPDMDGALLVEKLGSCLGTRSAAKIAVTGFPRPQVLPPGVIGWLEKPYSVRDLYEVLLVARREPVLAAS